MAKKKNKKHSNPLSDFNDEIDKEERQVKINKGEIEQIDIEEKQIKGMEETVLEDPIESTEATKEYDPLDEDVIQRDYTSGNNTQSNQTGEVFDYPEPEYVDMVDDVPESDGGITEEDPFTTTDEPSEPSGGSSSPETDTEASPKEKRRNAEKLADTILAGYASTLPKAFRHFAKFNMAKIKKMVLNDEINLSMVVTQDGQTVGNYIEQTNSEIDQILTVTEEMKAEIKDPLVDVLLENGLELTPLQRLLMALGSQIMTMAIQTYSLRKQSNESLETFCQFRADEIKAGLSARTRPYTPMQDMANDIPPPPTQRQPRESTSSPIMTEDEIETLKGMQKEGQEVNVNNIQMVETENESEETISMDDLDNIKEMTVDDYMNESEDDFDTPE